MPATPGYREATAVFDTLAPVQPDEAVIAESASSVAASIAWARSRGLDAEVISTGHASATAEPHARGAARANDAQRPRRGRPAHTACAHPGWHSLGCRCRGGGCRLPAPPPMPEEQPVYKVSWVGRPAPPLPVPAARLHAHWRVHVAEAQPASWSRAGTGGNLLRMHQGSWQRVSHAAIQFVRTAQRQGVSGYDIHEHVVDQARTQGSPAGNSTR